MSLPTLRDRTSGLLVHLTSLPGAHGCGDLGPSAHAFVRTLARAKQRWWQMLPVGPLGYGNSPYSAQSAFAGNPLFVALEPLVEAGWLDPAAIEEGEASALPRDHVDYAATERFRERCLRAAFAGLRARAPRDPKWLDLVEFEGAQRAWLDGFALYRAIKRAHGHVEWTRWPAPLRDREERAIAEALQTYRDDVAFEKFVQWQFREQWRALRAAATLHGVGLIGDVPIFVAHDSADVWQHRDAFHLDDSGAPTVIAGVPPDYFSTTGQRWGNPLYRWKHLARSHYGWWLDRMRTMLERFDAIRLDHFIGFQRYWQIPASEPTAVNGRWMKGPGAPFFATLQRELGDLPLIAEDLGAVTPAVKRLRDRFRFPGIKILQFAFGTDPNAHDFLPHNYRRRAVVYTGTHDNDTTQGWFHEPGGTSSTRSPEQTEKERRAVMTYLGATDRSAVHWDMIRAVEASVATTAILPLQDVLGLGAEARMNRPGTAGGNWEWRFAEGAVDSSIEERLASLAETYDRAPPILKEETPS